jgi:4-diphosphocytidyl-2-C-methyl-D-erythritol kinase
MMRGIGDVLSEPLELPALPAVLVNPGVAVATRDVFARLALAPGDMRGAYDETPVPVERDALLAYLAARENDLEPAASALAPVIGEVLAMLRAARGARLARMSGSGATCFALFDSGRAAAAAARRIKSDRTAWWVQATALG